MAHPFPISYASSIEQPGLLSRRQQPASYMHLELPPLKQLLTDKSKAAAPISITMPVALSTTAAVPVSNAVTASSNTPVLKQSSANTMADAAATAAAVAAAAAGASTVPSVATTSQAFDHTQMPMYPSHPPLYYSEMLPTTAGANDLFPATMVMGGAVTGAVSDASFAPPAFLDPTPMFTADPIAAAAVTGFMDQSERRSRQLSVSSNSSDKIYSFVAIPGTNHKKRPRRRYDEIERLYHCNWSGCSKAYGTLNHLNAHVSMQKHGAKRHPSEFKEMRKEWRRQKKERDAVKKASDDAVRQHRHEHQQHQQQQQQQFQVMPPPPFQTFPMPMGGYY